ncbi:MAG: hypothetical protein A2293_00470 [Elusimicrobia bacterium RIFOXYB2_FULL_49_7]|nr:MAG: hypothetical protein A2293_00470 [Elusimicrobia bacterium RIFOXYB2_FULL_49_7]
MVRLVCEEGLTLSEAANRTGVHPSMLHRWIRQLDLPVAGKNPPEQILKAHERELKRLRSDLRIMHRSLNIIRSAVCKVLKRNLPEIMQ